MAERGVLTSRTMRAARRLGLWVVVLGWVGCASYAPHSIEIKNRLAGGRFDSALEEVDRAKSASSRLLTLYETGLILHYAQRFEDSNLQFHEAEILYEDLYTKSVSRELGALLTSDTAIEYRGERFESAYLHYYKILNYLHLGDGDAALVECRKLNEKLLLFRDAGGTFYTDDPFLQYLTGLVYESEGELADAWVSYRVASDAFERLGAEMGLSAPPSLRCDLARAGSVLGYRDELPERRAGDPCPEPAPGSGSVVLLLETGFAPHRVEIQLVAPIFKDDNLKDDFDRDKFAWTLADRAGRRRVATREVSYWLTIAFPDIVAEPTGIAEIEVLPVEAPTSATRAARAANIEAVAVKRFEERRPRMLAKTLARALAKYLAKEKVTGKQGEVAGMLVNVFNVATERADTRSWSTLPGRIHLARFFLPPGSYTLQVNLRDSGGEKLITIGIPEVEVESGRTAFLNHRVF